MKTILRNFISVLRRFRMATLLNILGLSIAFAAFMVIMMQVSYDYTFDSCQPESEAIYRMDMQYQGEQVAIMSRPLARAFTESSPHIKAGTLMTSWTSDGFYSVERSGEIQNFQGSDSDSYPPTLPVFSISIWWKAMKRRWSNRSRP